MYQHTNWPNHQTCSLHTITQLLIIKGEGLLKNSNHPILQLYHYIPYHPIKKDLPTTPIRIACDCSCHQFTNSPSINDHLQIGSYAISSRPVLCNLAFCYDKFEVSTDIEAFLHIQLDKGSTCLYSCQTRQVSLMHTDLKLLFGATCSPFMLHAVINCHLSQQESSTAHDMLHSMYIDNIITGCNSEESVIEYYRTARSI